VGFSGSMIAFRQFHRGLKMMVRSRDMMRCRKMMEFAGRVSFVVSHDDVR